MYYCIREVFDEGLPLYYKELTCEGYTIWVIQMRAHYSQNLAIMQDMMHILARCRINQDRTFRFELVSTEDPTFLSTSGVLVNDVPRVVAYVEHRR